MAWTVIIKRDTNLANEGTVIATWTSTSGEVFTYTQRVKRTADGKATFITAAKLAQSTWETERSTIKTIQDNLETALNI